VEIKVDAKIFERLLKIVDIDPNDNEITLPSYNRVAELIGSDVGAVVQAYRIALNDHFATKAIDEK
jgi:hypothetical protein